MIENSPKKTVLFLCTHNSARSQMAEGLMNSLYSESFRAYSAGTEPSQVNPFAVKVMAEIGMDISQHSSKSLDPFIKQNFDYVITVCDHANETCPFFAGAEHRMHKSFPDPSAFTGSDADTLAVFRLTREQIKAWLVMNFGTP